MKTSMPRFSATIKVVPGPAFYQLDCSKTPAGYMASIPDHVRREGLYTLADRWADRNQVYSTKAYNCTMWGLYHEDGVILRHLVPTTLKRPGMVQKVRQAIFDDANHLRNLFWPVRGFITGGQGPSTKEPDRDTELRTSALKALVEETLTGLKIPHSILWGAKETEYLYHANTHFDVDNQTWHLAFIHHDACNRMVDSFSTPESVKNHLCDIRLHPEDALIFSAPPAD